MGTITALDSSHHDASRTRPSRSLCLRRRAIIHDDGLSQSLLHILSPTSDQHQHQQNLKRLACRCGSNRNTPCSANTTSSPNYRVQTPLSSRQPVRQPHINLESLALLASTILSLKHAAATPYRESIGRLEHHNDGADGGERQEEETIMPSAHAFAKAVAIIFCIPRTTALLIHASAVDDIDLVLPLLVHLMMHHEDATQKTSVTEDGMESGKLGLNETATEFWVGRTGSFRTLLRLVKSMRGRGDDIGAVNSSDVIDAVDAVFECADGDLASSHLPFNEDERVTEDAVMEVLRDLVMDRTGSRLTFERGELGIARCVATGDATHHPDDTFFLDGGENLGDDIKILDMPGGTHLYIRSLSHARVFINAHRDSRLSSLTIQDCTALEVVCMAPMVCMLHIINTTASKVVGAFGWVSVVNSSTTVNDDRRGTIVLAADVTFGCLFFSSTASHAVLGPCDCVPENAMAEDAEGTGDDGACLPSRRMHVEVVGEFRVDHLPPSLYHVRPPPLTLRQSDDGDPDDDDNCSNSDKDGDIRVAARRPLAIEYIKFTKAVDTLVESVQKVLKRERGYKGGDGLVDVCADAYRRWLDHEGRST